MKVLVINAGSSSLKYQLIETDKENALAKGVVDRVGQKASIQKHSGKGKFVRENLNVPTHAEAVKKVLDALIDSEYGVIDSVKEISAVGHRVVHGGEDFVESAIINKVSMAKIKANIDLAPLHQPANIIGIEACQKVLPNAPHVAVFDTTFHSTIPPKAYMYAVDYNDYKNYRLRKYGFHGTSHMFIASEVKRIYGKQLDKIIVCHLGNGASISAIKGGKCVDTTMGLTPLEGLMMGTRSGDIDPAAVTYLADKTGKSPKDIIEYLNKSCGALGISGVSSDFRDINDAAESGNERAQLAIAMFAYRVKKYIGSYAAVLGGVDCLAFTGGIGEFNPNVREPIVEGLEFLGIEVCKKTNDAAERDVISKISTGKTDVYIIPTNEELVIARETVRLSLKNER